MDSKNFEAEVTPEAIVYKPKRPRWKATTLTFTTDYDTDDLQTVFINDIRFIRAPEYQESCEVCE